MTRPLAILAVTALPISLTSCVRHFASVQPDGSVALDAYAVKGFLVEGKKFTDRKEVDSRLADEAKARELALRDTPVPHTQPAPLPHRPAQDFGDRTR